MTVAALFVRSDSVYKSLSDVDAWDAERDARKWPGGTPCIAHPPCRGWGRLRHMAKASPAEKHLALIALDFVDENGGVLEHPYDSTLWPHVDGRPGWWMAVDQSWWGHRARKRTGLYIVGVPPRRIPRLPIDLAEPTHIVAGGHPKDAETAKRKRKAWPCRPSVTPREAEATPPEFARWLVELARRCGFWKEQAQRDEAALTHDNSTGNWWGWNPHG